MRALVITGPTAAGKTELALHVCGTDFEIISADSVQVYRFLDIGSGKPDKEELARVRHHLIDVVDPDFDFTAGEFCRRAAEAAEGITSRSRIPLFAGGTGMYIDSFFKGMSDVPPVGREIRESIVREISECGTAALYEELKYADPLFAEKVHPNDSQRIIRGLEVYRATGSTISSFFSMRRGAETEETLYIGIEPERQELRKKIDLRVDKMIEKGFIEEVEKLRSMGYSPELRSMKSIGYAEINELLDGSAGREEAIQKIKTVTKQYAKRQMTWFRRNKKINWFRPEDKQKITQKILNWLN